MLNQGAATLEATSHPSRAETVVEAVPEQASAHVATQRVTRVARNVAVVLMSQVGVWIAGSGIAVLLPRYLGDTNLGRLTFAIAFTNTTAAIVLFGSERYLTREIARQPERAAHLAFNALLSRIPLLIICSLGTYGFMVARDYPQATRTVVYLLTASMWITAFGNTWIAVLQGLERMTLTAVASIVERVISGLIGIAIIILASQGMIGYALVLLLANLVSVAIIGGFFARVVGHSWRFDAQVCRTMYSASMPFFIWGLSLLIYGSIDITILSIMAADDVVGWYGTAYRFVGIAGFFPFAVTTAMLPSISNASRADLESMVRRCLDLVMFVSIPIAVFFLVGAGSLIQFLHYGSGFDHSVILLQILAVHIPLVAFTMIAGTILIAMNHENARTKAAVAAAVLSPALNAATIPFFQHSYGNGAIGSAIVTVVVESFMLVMLFLMMDRSVLARSNVSTTLRCLGAGVPMAAAMYLATPFKLPGVFVAGSVAYLAAALAFRAITVTELLDLPKLVLRRKSEVDPVDDLAEPTALPAAL